MKIVILGAGITGLIWKFYNKDSIIITKDIGGQMKSNFSYGPRYLHANQHSLQFLSEINYSIKQRLIRVGYFSDDGWTSPDLSFRQKYFLKSRKTSSLQNFEDSVMNSNQSEFFVYDVNFNSIINTLSSNIKESDIITDSIQKIDIQNKHIFLQNSVIEYDQLISTIPLPVFCQLSNTSLNQSLESSDMTYVLVNENFFDMNDYDFVYDIRTTTSFHRLSKDSNGIVLDYFGDYKENNFWYKDKCVLKNSQLLSKVECLQIPDVLFIGRYGAWNRKWKTEDVIKEAYLNY